MPISFPCRRPPVPGHGARDASLPKTFFMPVVDTTVAPLSRASFTPPVLPPFLRGGYSASGTSSSQRNGARVGCLLLPSSFLPPKLFLLPHSFFPIPSSCSAQLSSVRLRPRPRLGAAANAKAANLALGVLLFLLQLPPLRSYLLFSPLITPPLRAPAAAAAPPPPFSICSDRSLRFRFDIFFLLPPLFLHVLVCRS